MFPISDGVRTHTSLGEASDFYSRTTSIADHEDRARVAVQ